MAIKKTEECSGLEVLFLLQSGLLILDSCRKQGLRQSLWVMALCRRVTLGEQRRESREEGGARWGRIGGLWGSLLCIFIFFSRCTHLPGFQDHVTLLWLVLLPRPWSQRPPIPCLLWVRIYLTRHQQPLISPGLVTCLPRQPVGNPYQQGPIPVMKRYEGPSLGIVMGWAMLPSDADVLTTPRPTPVPQNLPYLEMQFL